MPAKPHAATATAAPNTGWLLYDGACRFCTATATRVAPLIETRGFAILPLQTPWVRKRLGLAEDDPLREMIVLTRDDRRFGGADAALFLARHFWWSTPLTWLALLPGIKPLLRRLYAWIAARRSCAAGACTLPPRVAAGSTQSRAFVAVLVDWLPLVLLPPTIMIVADKLPPWVFMWALAGTIFAGCKWLTWRRGPRSTTARSLGFLLAWPGMDAGAFLRDERTVERPRRSEWLFAAAKLLGGAMLVWGGIRAVPDDRPLLAGWVGMVGLIFLLHFGAFHLLSLVWRHAGVNAAPLMRAPILATSLAEFWGRRWNAAFNDLARRLVFAPLARGAGTTVAMLAVFLVSGLLHDLVISVPARGGYGLPTLYFLLQAVGVLVERTAFTRRPGLNRAFTIFVTVAPLGLLFHPPFVHGVMLPMFHALGAW